MCSFLAIAGHVEGDAPLKAPDISNSFDIGFDGLYLCMNIIQFVHYFFFFVLPVAGHCRVKCPCDSRVTLFGTSEVVLQHRPRYEEIVN